MEDHSIALVKKYFDRYGWKYRIIDKRKIISGWQEEKRQYIINVKVYETFVQFQVKVFDLSSYAKNRNLLTLLQSIMILNKECHLVKIFCTEDLSVCIRAEALRDNFTYQNFSTTIGVLAYYSKEVLKEIGEEILDHDTNIHRLFKT